MAIAETLVIYGILGLAVATALQVTDRTRSVFAAVPHALCWPFFVAALVPSQKRASSAGEGEDELAPTVTHPRVRHHEERLLDALTQLDGLAEDVLAPEVERIRDLASSLDSMQSRLDEMDELLSTEEFDEARARERLEQAKQEQASDARIESAKTKLRHIRRLEQMRSNLKRDLRTALGKVDEITTQISLLRFADHPEREVSQLIEDIAATVDGVSEGVLET